MGGYSIVKRIHYIIFRNTGNLSFSLLTFNYSMKILCKIDYAYQKVYIIYFRKIARIAVKHFIFRHTSK